MILQQSIHEIKRIIEPLLGRRAWDASIGHGSFITVEFGNQPIDDKTRSEWHLWIYCCAWYISDGDTLISACNDQREKMQGAIELIRLLSQLAAVSKVREASIAETQVYKEVHADSRSTATSKFASAVEFRKKSINGLTLNNIELILPSLETKFHFEEHLTLHTFPTYTDDSYAQQWMLFTPEDMVLVIGPGNEWSYRRTTSTD